LHLIFRTDDEDVTIVVQPDGQDWQLVIDGQEVPLQATPYRNGGWLVETHQGRRRLWVAARGDERLVFCDGKVHTLRLPDPEHADDGDQPGGGRRRWRCRHHSYKRRPGGGPGRCPG